MNNQTQQTRNLFLKVLNERLWMVHDCLTITLARQEKVADWGTGGGNFLMTIGLMSVLGFLSKLYLCLMEPDKIVTKSDFDNIKNFIQILKQDGKYQNYIDKINLFPMKPGLINETDAFSSFCYIIQNNQVTNLGFPNEEKACKEAARVAWNFFRNKLTHMAWPYQQVAVLPSLKLKSVKELESFIRISTYKAFSKEGEFYRFIPEKLIFDILDIQKWLINQVQSGSFDDNLDFTNQWMDDRL